MHRQLLEHLPPPPAPVLESAGRGPSVVPLAQGRYDVTLLDSSLRCWNTPGSAVSGARDAGDTGGLLEGRREERTPTRQTGAALAPSVPRCARLHRGPGTWSAAVPVRGAGGSGLRS